MLHMSAHACVIDQSVVEVKRGDYGVELTVTEGHHCFHVTIWYDQVNDLTDRIGKVAQDADAVERFGAPTAAGMVPAGECYDLETGKVS